MYKEKKNIVRIHENNFFVKLQQEIFCSWLVLVATIHPHSKFGNSVPLKVVDENGVIPNTRILLGAFTQYVE
jgi:hypothetical protein